MWTPEYFALRDRQRILRFMRDHPFAVLSMRDANGRMEAVHLPVMHAIAADGSLELLAHLARANPLHGSFDGSRDALVVFSGPHGYVSPSDYASPGQVPTWNYSTVHAVGKPQIISDPARSQGVVAGLAAFIESQAGGWRMEMLDTERREGLLQGIVAFRLLVERLEGKLKLSQNKQPADIRAVAARQRELGNVELADMMLAALGDH